MRPSATIPFVIFVLFGLAGSSCAALLVAMNASPGAALGVLVSAIVLGMLTSASVRVVAQWERLVVLRLGRFRRIASPGMRFVIPVVDSTIGVEMRTQTVDIAAQRPGAMQLRTLQTIDGLGPSASNTVVLALPLEMLEAIRAYTGSVAK